MTTLLIVVLIFIVCLAASVSVWLWRSHVKAVIAVTKEAPSDEAVSTIIKKAEDIEDIAWDLQDDLSMMLGRGHRIRTRRRV